MTPNYDKMVILRIAKYYYLDGLSQQEISERVNIHRSQISRLLKLARELGYVQIRICPPESHSADSLAELLSCKLGLREVVIAPSLSPQINQAESFSFFAARYLEEILPRCKNIGIGLGKTLYHVAAQLSPQKTEQQLEFFSIAGSSGTNNPYLQASVILDNFARPFNGSCHYNNFPICMARSRMSPFDISRFNDLQKSYETLDTVVLSIGGPYNADYPYLEEFTLAVNEFSAAKAFTRPHGNLLGNVFYEDHEVLDLQNDYIMTSMNLKTLSKMPHVICIAYGKEKVDVIISAARQNYIKSLITDETTAKSILKKMNHIDPAS